MSTKEELSAAAAAAAPPFHAAMTLPEDRRLQPIADQITQIANTNDVIVSFTVKELPSVSAAQAAAGLCKACACGCLCLL